MCKKEKNSSVYFQNVKKSFKERTNSVRWKQFKSSTRVCDHQTIFSIVSTDPDAFDSSSGNLLTVVELDALQTMAALQVLKGHVSDEGAVVQLHHGEALLATGTAAQSSDAVVRDQLAVGQRLYRGTGDGVRRTGRADRWIKDTVIQTGWERTWHKLRPAGANVYQCLQTRAVDWQLNQGVICHLRTGQAWLTHCSHMSRDRERGSVLKSLEACAAYSCLVLNPTDTFFLCVTSSVSPSLLPVKSDLTATAAHSISWQEK